MGLEELEETYLQERKKYENLSETLMVVKREGVHQVEDLAERSRFYLREFMSEELNMTHVYSYLESEREQFEEQIKQEQNRIDKKLEDLESKHRRERLVHEQSKEEK